MSAPDDASLHWEGKQEGNETDDLVAAYLLIDIQHSVDWADDLLRRIAQASDGELERWTRLGNAYELVLTPDGATIEEAISTGADIKAVPVPLDLLARATRAWRGSFAKS